jgi:hypothetical protein
VRVGEGQHCEKKRRKERSKEKRKGRTGHGEGDEHDGTVDVHRDLLVATHRLVVRVGDGAVAETLDGVEDGLPVPNSDVGEGRTDGEVAAEVVNSVRRSVTRETLDSESVLVEGVVGVEDGRLVVGGSVGVEELLGEEGEGLGAPGIGVVHRGEENAAEADTEEEREKSVSKLRRRTEQMRRRTRCTARSASS